MRKTDRLAVRWRAAAPAPPSRPTSPPVHAGGSWTFADRRGVLGLRSVRMLTALALSLASAAAGAAPALAAKPSSGGGSTAQSCTSVLSDSATTSLASVRQAVGASSSNLTGAGVGVAVIDTGVNPVGGLTGRNKVVDGPDLSFDALNANLRFRDVHGHGTNMAAIIAAQGATGGDGVAPDAQLVNVKVGTGDGTVDVSQVIAAIDWVVQNRARHNVRVLNLAFDTDAGQSYVLDPLSHAVENAWKAGIVVVVAGGNDGRAVQRLGNPATNPYVIAVGAAEDHNGWKVPTWSSTGDGVRNPDLVAPGMNVLSAAVPGSYLVDTYSSAVCENSGSLSLRGSGTSQAAAVVSGAVALLLQQRPSLTPDQVEYLLTSTAVNLGRTATQQGSGLVNLVGALAAPTPGVVAVQTHVPSTGLGTLDGARGSFYVGTSGDYLSGERTAFGGTWTPSEWRAASDARAAWTNQTWSGATWSGGTWMGATWSGATWSGATWSGATWSGATWSGATWSGATWSGATWSGATWSGATWSGATWSGATWSGSSWG